MENVKDGSMKKSTIMKQKKLKKKCKVKQKLIGIFRICLGINADFAKSERDTKKDIEENIGGNEQLSNINEKFL